MWTNKDKTRSSRHGKGLRWQAIWTNGRGSEVKKSHRTKDAALAWIQEQDAKHRTGYTPGGHKMTVSEAGQQWMRDQLGWTAKNRHTTTQIWTKTIEPEFGKYLLESVSRQQIRDWLYEMSTKYAPSTVQTYYGRFRTFMLWCVTEKYLPYSPTDGIKVPTGKKRKYYFLTPQHFDDLYDVFHKHYQDAIETAVTTAVRPGELWELRGRDVGQKPGRLRVERAVSDVGGVTVLGDTKTGEPRDVPLMRHIEKKLERRAEQAGPDGLLFPSVKGAQVDLSNFNNRYWRKAVSAANLPAELRVYDLRHTAASWAIREGASVLAVQRMLGHSTPTETLNTYAHLFDDELDQVTASLSKMLKRHKKKKKQRQKKARQLVG